MTSRLLRYLPHLKKLCKMTSANRNKLLKGVLKKDKQLLYCICECATNVIKGNVQTSDKQKCRLHRWRNSLRTIAKKRTSLKKKRQLIQKGGFLPALLAVIASGLGGVIGGAFNR